MFPLPRKREAAGSPESTELNKKDKKLRKKDSKNKANGELKAAARIEMSPSKI